MAGRIFYADKIVLDKIGTDFQLIEESDWYSLYQNKLDKELWRLSKYDKYQEQYFVKVDSKETWDTFDDRELRIQLLKDTRGTENKSCIWEGCSRSRLRGLEYCERHAYEDMGIRK